MAYRILLPQPGIEPGPTAVKVQSPVHRTISEFPRIYFNMFKQKGICYKPLGSLQNSQKGTKLGSHICRCPEEGPRTVPRGSSGNPAAAGACCWTGTLTTPKRGARPPGGLLHALRKTRCIHIRLRRILTIGSHDLYFHLPRSCSHSTVLAVCVHLRSKDSKEIIFGFILRK